MNAITNKPINDTSASPEMEQHIKDINSGKLIRDEKARLEKEKKVLEDKEKRQRMVCPTCHRGELKKTPSGLYACGHCGLKSSSPAYVIDPKQSGD